MKKKMFFILVSIFSILIAFGQQKPDTDYIKNNTYYFEVNVSNIQGKGADILLRSIEESQFFVLGEEHYSAQVSKFTNAIIPLLAKHNYSHFVAEIGPSSAAKITTLIQNNQSLYNFNTEVYDLVGEIPIPFLDGKEDEVFLKKAINNGFEFWGIDQEYMTAQVFLIDEIYNLSENKSALRTLYSAVKKYLISETKMAMQNDSYHLFTELSNSTLVNEFFKSTDITNLKVQKIIADLKESWETYRLREVKDYYSSLHSRLDIMQRNFREYYSKALKADTLPKAIIKIGGKHASKGRSLDNIFDIGNFAMELANFNGKKSTAVLMFPSAYLNDDGSIDNNIDKE
ncbi:MAG: hypothetical protein NWQ38_04140, partial [Cellulophaga sp.]|nr:hypothetical protein [Cellulophaga sp.]